MQRGMLQQQAGPRALPPPPTWKVSGGERATPARLLEPTTASSSAPAAVAQAPAATADAPVVQQPQHQHQELASVDPSAGANRREVQQPPRHSAVRASRRPQLHARPARRAGARHGRRAGGAVAAAAGTVALVAKCGLGLASFATRLGAALILKSFLAPSWPALRLACLAALPFRGSPVRAVARLAAKAPVLLTPAAAPVAAAAGALCALSVPVACMAAVSPLVKRLAPGTWRTLRLWRRLLPIYAGYMLTRFTTSADRLPALPAAEAEARWEARHDWGGRRVYEMVLELSGYFVKSAQILGSKSDFMPVQWTRHLSKCASAHARHVVPAHARSPSTQASPPHPPSALVRQAPPLPSPPSPPLLHHNRLFDSMPARPYSEVAATLERELPRTLLAAHLAAHQCVCSVLFGGETGRVVLKLSTSNV